MRLIRAQANTLVAIILVLAVGAAIGGLTYNYVVKQKYASDIEICKTSIYLAAKSKETLGARSPLLGINCKRHSWMFDRESDAEINKAIAEAVYNCVHVSHAGALDWTEASKIGMLAGKSFCIHCDNFKFRGDAKENYDSASIFDYFSNNKPPKWPKTYFEYFEGITRDGSFYLDFNEWSGIDTNKTYELYFAHYNIPWGQQLLNKFNLNPDVDICLSDLFALARGDAGAIAVRVARNACIGPVIATTNMKKGRMLSFVRFTPAENIKECDVWLN